METQLIVTIAQYAIKYGIPAAQELIKLMKESDETISIEKWNAVFDVSQKTEEDYVKGK